MKMMNDDDGNFHDKTDDVKGSSLSLSLSEFLRSKITH